jgi:hypothetical protein
MEPKGSLLLQSHDLPLVPNPSQMNPVHISFLKEKEYVSTSSGVHTEGHKFICDCMNILMIVSVFDW